MVKKSKYLKIAKRKVTEKLKKGDNIKMINVSSSNVKSLGYDIVNAIMQSDFLSGSRYQYYQVPQDIFNAVIDGKWTAKSPTPHGNSVGAALDHYVKKGGYSYKKIY